MKKILVLIIGILIISSCGRTNKTVTEQKNTAEDKAIIINKEQPDFEKIPDPAKDSLNKLPDYDDVIKSVQFSTDGKRNRNIVNFFAPDSLMITADVYTTNRDNPFILLCHQAGYSRGEYINTVKELMLLGYNCVAIDQRSGDKVNGVVNETAKRAIEKGLPHEYLDAKEDILTAIDFTYALNKKQPITIVGSSYSATLVMMLSIRNPKIAKVAAFSPGEYFKGVSILENLAGFDKPVFVTGAKKEIPAIKKMTTLIVPDYLNLYEPKKEGIHGSRALWFSTPGYVGAWKAFKTFLKK